MKAFLGPAVIAASSIAAPAAAQEGAQPSSNQAVGAEMFYSSDSDDTEVVRIAIDYDFRALDEDDYVGVRIERAWYQPNGAERQSRDRLFLRAADTAGDWQWRARVGTDGDTLIGSASVNDDSRFRKEFFVERDIVETRQGLTRGIYSTFIGAAVDLPVDDRNVLTALAGVQEFTGSNERLHLRGSYIHVVKPELGASIQLRGRWFRSTAPREFDYYSPRWYAQILPVLQVRRFVDGWELVGAGGIGIQRDSNSDWGQSRYAHARVRSPAQETDWRLSGEFTYSNTPSNNGDLAAYSYVQFAMGLTRLF